MPNTPPPLAPPRDYTPEITAASSSIIVLLIFLTLLPIYLYRKMKRAEAQNIESEMLQVHAAIETTRSLIHAGVFIPAGEFVQLSRLQMYEELRDSGQLRYRDTLEQLSETDCFYIFISHQYDCRHLARLGP